MLVEHYVARESQTSLIGNVYLGRVQNVLPSMEAAFIDIGKGRNAVLYAGEVNWSALGHKDGQPRKIESVLSSGQSILVQVTKDPIGHKGARLTSQVSLAGRFLVYVPDGTTSGISRKLPDTERNRLKTLLKEIVPDTAGVIVRTAAEGATEDELTRDVERLKARWEDIEKKAKGTAPQLLYGEPDLTLKVVRDLFTEDFAKLVIEGDDAWETVQSYVAHVAPDLEERLERYEREEGPGRLRGVPHRRADQEGPRPQGLAALRRLAGHRPHRGDDRRRRQHRQVHRLRRQPRGDRHQEQPRGRRGDRPPAPAARHRRHHRRRLHRHGARVQPRPRAAAPGRVPGPRPHPPPGRRGDLARSGPDDPQADRHRAAGVVLPRLPALPRPRRRRSRRRRSSPSRPRRRPPRPPQPEPRQGPGRPGRGRPRPRRPRPRTSPRWRATSAPRPSRPRRAGRGRGSSPTTAERPSSRGHRRGPRTTPTVSPSRPRPTESRRRRRGRARRADAEPPSPRPSRRRARGRAEPEPEPTPPAEPEPPRVVTRTRRRSASRPAGPPTSAAATDGSGGPRTPPAPDARAARATRPRRCTSRSSARAAPASADPAPSVRAGGTASGDQLDVRGCGTRSSGARRTATPWRSGT